MDKWTAILTGLAIFTLIIDVLDLAPQIRSFRFVFSLTYAIYYVLHFVFGLLAATIIDATGRITNPWLLALVSVLSSIAVLENLTVKFGGQSIVDLSVIFEDYRASMISEQGERARRAEGARIITLTSELIALNKSKLEAELTTMLVSIYGGQEAKKRLEELREVAAGDDELFKRILASEMVQLNVEYVLAGKDTWLQKLQRPEG
jgi:hypothetical protein